MRMLTSLRASTTCGQRRRRLSRVAASSASAAATGAVLSFAALLLSLAGVSPACVVCGRPAGCGFAAGALPAAGRWARVCGALCAGLSPARSNAISTRVSSSTSSPFRSDAHIALGFGGFGEKLFKLRRLKRRLADAGLRSVCCRRRWSQRARAGDRADRRAGCA